MATVGYCKKCGEKDKLVGQLCENCRLELEAKNDPGIEDEKEVKSREALEKEIAERRRDKKFWLGK